MNGFSSQKVLENHKTLCNNQKITRINFPEKDRFHFHKNYFKVPFHFRIYADFECYNQPVEEEETGKTKTIFKQLPIAVGYYIMSDLPDVLETGYHSYFGEDCVEWFVTQISQIEERMKKFFDETDEALQMTSDDKEHFNNNNICWLCEKEAVNKVRDHDHLTGKYRAPACYDCNLNAKKRSNCFIPILFHNFSGYDCHLFFKELFDNKGETKIKVLPKTDENYIAVDFGCLRFLDSLRFLSSSLDQLVKGLDETPILKEYFTEFNLLNKKLAYPYEKYKSPEEFMESARELKDEDFYTTLKQGTPDKKEIKRTMDIINHFSIQNGKQLTELYLKTDVLLLADVFENFVNISVNEFGINPLYCVSLPGYTWHCGLKYTEIELEYIKNPDMLLCIENNIRGGISSVMGDRYVKSNEQTKILYLDANNLYGWAMSQNMPYKDFEFVVDVSIDKILSTSDDSHVGYFVECDLKYPNSIKFKTKNFPLAPVKRKVDYQELSDYQKELYGKSYIPQEKLICDWKDKKNYLVHYRMLKFYVKMGMEVEKVHRVIRFKQKLWLKEYIDYNTNKRSEAITDFEKDFFKLLNNAFYGKTMENVRGRVNIDMIENDKNEEIIKRQSKLTFKTIPKNFGNFSIFYYSKNQIKFDKPIYLGFTVLELSKLLMYQFYYDVLQPYFGEKNIQNHYTDTDSFILSVKTEDIIEDLKNLSEHFDFSNVDKDCELYSEVNKKVIGKFKSEVTNPIFIERFIALRSKMYSYEKNKNIIFEPYSCDKAGAKLENNIFTQEFNSQVSEAGAKLENNIFTQEFNNSQVSEAGAKLENNIFTQEFNNSHNSINKLKGLCKASSEKINFKNYENALFKNDKQEHSNYTLKSKKHQMILQKIKKSTLTASDDKRYYINAIESLPFD